MMEKARMVVVFVGLLMVMGGGACASSDPTSMPRLDAQADPNADGPGSGAEICNGIDDDGDTMVDESAYGTGVIVEPCATICGPGQKICLGGVMTTCSAPEPDIWGECPCSEGETRDCFTECGAGTETCIAGSFLGCTSPEPQPEQCDNGLDDDCDGDVDEDCGGCVPGEIKRCGSDTGECSSGTRTCRTDASWGSCVGNVGAVDEICDGLDNDCNGEPDDGLSPDLSEYNDSCTMARRMTDVYEGYGVVTETASIYPAGDEDWMWVRAVEGWHDCEPLGGQCYYEFVVDIDPPEGSDLQFCLYPAWPMDAPGCDSVGDPSTTFCSEPGELSMALSWEGVCMIDDTLDFVVVVKEWLGSEPSCAPYTIAFSMYGPTEICPWEDVEY